MPRGDRRGPMGMGPMTGRGAGFCAGNTQAGFAGDFGRGMGRGMGNGRGFGGGFGRGFGPGFGAGGWGVNPYLPVDEKVALQAQSEVLKGQMDAITRRLDELSKDSAEK